MDSLSDTHGRSFVEVIVEKYSPENFPYRRGPGVGVVIITTPQGSPMKDRLNLPRVLVLEGSGISRAGDQTEIAAFCAHISKIVSNIPNLDFLNLSSNPLATVPLEAPCVEAFAGVRCLVLDNTQVSWDTVLQLTQELPE
uniref:Uncharacterized protein n=1 Tax=Knipowitschia caucasica TaxID=637954 RepID=A0AAV2J4T2_KNICA